MCSWQVTSTLSDSSVSGGIGSRLQPVRPWCIWSVTSTPRNSELSPNKKYRPYEARESWERVLSLTFTSCVAWSNSFIALSLRFYTYKFKVVIIELRSPQWLRRASALESGCPHCTCGATKFQMCGSSNLTSLCLSFFVYKMGVIIGSFVKIQWGQCK